MTPPVNIELLEEVVKKATPGEWKSSYVNETGVMVIVDEKGFAVLSCDWLLDTDEDVQEIVALHNAAPALLAELRAARKVVEAARVFEEFRLKAMELRGMQWWESVAPPALAAYEEVSRG